MIYIIFQIINGWTKLLYSLIENALVSNGSTTKQEGLSYEGQPSAFHPLMVWGPLCGEVPMWVGELHVTCD